MKRSKFFNSLIAVVLASVIAIAGVGCIVTGFDLAVGDWVHLTCLCVFFAIVCTLFYQFRWGNLVLTLLSLIAVALLLRYGDLLLSAEKLLTHITRIYDRGYHWGYIRWSSQDLTHVLPDTALTVAGCLIATSVTWTVCRRKWFGFGLIAGLLPLICCCVVTDTVPDSTELWLLLTALVLLTMTQRLRFISLADANRLTALLLVPVVLLSSLLFRYSDKDHYQIHAQNTQTTLLKWALWLTNQGILPEGNITVPGDNPGIGIGNGISLFDDNVDLSLLGNRNTGNQIVMYVTSTHPGSLYLRGQSYDTYTGTGWESNIDTSNEGGWPRKGLVPGGEVTVSTLYPSNILFFPYYPEDSSHLKNLEDGRLCNEELVLEYSFDRLVVGRNKSVTFTSLTRQQKLVYLRLPEETQATAQVILDELFKRFNLTDERKIELIADYVRNSAKYDENTDKMPSDADDFALWFLEESDTGYCVHFATAATVLLRAAGFPARYVTGYMVAAPNGKTAVTADQAHAWVEYLDPNYGWTVLEATPAAGSQQGGIQTETTVPTQTPRPTETTRPTLPTVTTEPTQTPETTLPTETTQPTLPTVSTPTGPSIVTTPTDSTVSTLESTVETTVPSEPGNLGEATQPQEQINWLEAINLKWIRSMLLAAAIWLLLAGQYNLRIRLRKKQLSKGAPNRQTLKRWRYARLLSRISGYSAKDLLPLAEKAAFSQYELTAEELAQFEQWYREANQALLQKPWLIQFFLRLLFAIE